jgi:protein ImuB
MAHWLALIPKPSSLASTEVTSPPMGLRPFSPGGQPAWGGPARAEVSAGSQQHAIGWWALQFTPRVALCEDAVLLELAASERLFGGRAALRRRILKEAEAFDCAARAWAPTGLGALALARGGVRNGFARPLPELLDALPLHAMSRIAAERPLLARLGCRTLGDVRRLPRAGLSRRCAPEVLIALDQAYGEQPECHVWLELPESFEARLELPCRAESVAALMQGARHLFTQMAGWLAARHAGVRHCTLRWRHDGQRARAAGPGGELTIHTAEATRDVEYLARLLHERLNRTGLKAPVSDLVLCATEPESLTACNASLLLEASPQREPLHRLLERLSARLGPEHVRRPQLVADHRLEAMQLWHPATLPQPPASTAPVPVLPQPSWILPQPLPLAVHQEKPVYQGVLELLSGPHRIEAGWWDRRRLHGNVIGDLTRDYYLALSPQAGLLWIYRHRMVQEGDNWFLHGVFA